ncbi:uncharacterized protein LOC113342364 [Papaver somniferum]|uniref:uncharacterized protein LOC113342364 n=1 Tax=Papaver somniferum TaxID=3469 RepID=UPI000E6F7F59|nr:uncharacterized protein LOC113342364 [Papaver somniferum]
MIVAAEAGIVVREMTILQDVPSQGHPGGPSQGHQDVLSQGHLNGPSPSHQGVPSPSRQDVPSPSRQDVLSQGHLLHGMRGTMDLNEGHLALHQPKFEVDQDLMKRTTGQIRGHLALSLRFIVHQGPRVMRGTMYRIEGHRVQELMVRVPLNLVHPAAVHDITSRHDEWADHSMDFASGRTCYWCFLEASL